MPIALIGQPPGLPRTLVLLHSCYNIASNNTIKLQCGKNNMISFSEILFRLAATLILAAVVGFEGKQKVQATISKVFSELHSLPGIKAIHADLRSPDA